jgi:hypothetical protein
MKKIFCLLLSASVLSLDLIAQNGDPKLTEVYTPVPKIVTPGTTNNDAPSDAIILFDGKNLDEWVSVKDPKSPAEWTVGDGVMTVNKTKGNIQTKRSFTDHLCSRWSLPAPIDQFI